MSLTRAPRALLQSFRTQNRLFSQASRLSAADAPESPSAAENDKRMGSNPKANQPDSINQYVRNDTPNTDTQSSSSQDEHKTGDDHPAKQPDTQAEPSRKTGIGGQTEVKGGKAGLGARGDKQ